MYAYAIFLLVKLSKFDIKKLKSKRIKEVTPTFKVQQKVHKNIYYDTLNNNHVDNSSNINSNINNSIQFDDEVKIKSGWKNAESNEDIYEEDKVEMNMFRNDKQ